LLAKIRQLEMAADLGFKTPTKADT